MTLQELHEVLAGLLAERPALGLCVVTAAGAYSPKTPQDIQAVTVDARLGMPRVEIVLSQRRQA